MSGGVRSLTKAFELNLFNLSASRNLGRMIFAADMKALKLLCADS